MIILYGNDNYRVDVSELVQNKFTTNGMVCIPNNDHMRAKMFGDPAFGEAKFIKIFDNQLNSRIYNSNQEIWINKNIDFNNTPINKDNGVLMGELNELKDKIKLNNNVDWILNNPTDFNSDETFEQFMAYKFIKPTSVVLELGGNIGRNSTTIGSILDKSENLVVLETDLEITECLKKNRDDNNMQFHVEGCALSKRKLLQKANTWNTIPSDHLIEGYNKVKNITIEELQDKYNLHFDTLVADCEGALYYILQDEPNILDQFSMVLVENDYFDNEKRYFVEKLYQDKGFKRIYVERHPEVNMPVDEFFFEVWVK